MPDSLFGSFGLFGFSSVSNKTNKTGQTNEINQPNTFLAIPASRARLAQEIGQTDPLLAFPARPASPARLAHEIDQTDLSPPFSYISVLGQTTQNPELTTQNNFLRPAPPVSLASIFTSHHSLTN